MNNKQFIPFFLICILHLIGESTGQEGLTTYTKPLLMPALLVGIVLVVGITPWLKKPIIWVTAALIFSTAGDTLLLMEKRWNEELFFLLGLGGFLMAQCCYIMAYTSCPSNGSPRNLIPIYLLYLAGFLWLLYPHMNLDLKIPVTMYGCILLTMSWMSWRTYSIDQKLGLQISIGSILFVVSDSLIAINRFVMTIPAAGLLIMTTYLVAQYLMSQGLIRVLK